MRVLSMQRLIQSQNVAEIAQVFGASVLADMPILEIDEVIERIDAVDGEQLTALASELFDPARLCAAAIGPDELAFRRAVEPFTARPVPAS